MSAFNSLKERWEYEVQEKQLNSHCPKSSLNSSMKAAWRVGTLKYGSFTCRCYHDEY